MKKITFRLLVISIIAILAACGGGSEDKEEQGTADDSTKKDPTVLIANSVWPDDNYISEGMKLFSEELEQATDGEVIIDVKTGGSLGFEGGELLKAVRDNQVPITDFVANAVTGDEPIFDMISLPFLIRNIEDSILMNELARDYYDSITEEKWNQKILYVNPWPGTGFWTKDKVESIEDLKNIKMRTIDKNGSDVVERVGGTPYQLPFGEVYSALSTGIIDSVLTSSPTAEDAKFWEVLGYYAPANVTMGVGFVTMNLDEFNKLDEQTQETIMEVSKKIEEEMWTKVVEVDENAIATSVENGIEVNELSDEFADKLFELTNDLRDEWIDNAPEEAQQIINDFLEQTGRK